jgi:ketosteroid isomerase-like protein
MQQGIKGGFATPPQETTFVVDNLQSSMSPEDEVCEASRQFYAGLNRMANGDARPLADIWSHSAAATAMHPIGGRQVGWEAVKASFEQVAKLASDGKIELKDQRIDVVGDMACEVGVEQGHFSLANQQVRIEHRVTNIYQREAGAWKITHHHTDSSPAMMEALSRLSPPSGKPGR